MAYIIVRPTRREREERLAESAVRGKERGIGIRGVVRNTEEAYEVQRMQAREGEEFKQPYAVSGYSKEAQRADFEMMQRAGIRDDLIEEYQAYEIRRSKLRTPFDWEKQ